MTTTEEAMEVMMRLPLNKAKRKEICDAAMEAMGAYVEALAESDSGKWEFSNWSPEEFERFVGVAFDMIAPAVMTSRIIVTPPVIYEDPPFFEDEVE